MFDGVRVLVRTNQDRRWLQEETHYGAERSVPQEQILSVTRAHRDCHFPAEKESAMMSANVVLDAISSHEWVQRLPRQHIEKLAKLAEEKDFEQGDVLFHQGDRADLFYVIVSGTVGMKLTLPWNANSLIAQVVIAGEEIGWDAFIEEGVRSFTAKAMTPVRALIFNGRELRAECECDPQFGFSLMKQLLRVVSDRLVATRLQHLIRS